ncbi:hypothetical protein BH20ACT17_BH20ACT17_02050 [soil metagenome]
MARANGNAPTASAATITLTAKATGATPIDLGRKGASLGDEFLEHGTLTDAAGHSAGSFQLVAQLVSGKTRHGSEQTTMTLHLASGTLQVAGGHGLTEGYVIPVIGGTSGYAGARGTLTVAAGQHESERLTILLQD